MARNPGPRLFAGAALRNLRRRSGIGQAAMAERIGLSVGSPGTELEFAL